MVKLVDVSLYYPHVEREILHNINWHIQDNDKWILFGRNGSGKTKLLEIITGYIYPSTGEVIRFGKPHLGHDIRELRTRIGYVSTSLKEKFSLRETIIDVIISGIFASIGLYVEPTKDQIAKARMLLETINMQTRSMERFSILSDGEKQKVLMARAMIDDPDLVILDEAAKGLDLSAREDLLGSIKLMCSQKKVSLIYVTHHTEEITDLFTNLFILEDGQCLYQGSVTKGLTGKNLSEIFKKNIEVKKMGTRFYTMINDV